MNIDIYERSIVFVQRLKDGHNPNLKNFTSYADLTYIVKNKIITDFDIDNIDIGENNDFSENSISLHDKNIKIVGRIEKLIIFMLEPTGTDKYFFEVSKKYSDILVKEDISGVGVNYNGIIASSDPDQLIKEKIIVRGPSIISDADKAALKTQYKDEKATYNVNIEAGEVTKNGLKKQGILVAFNYHREIKHQNLMKQKMDEFQSSLERVKVKFDEQRKKIVEFFDE